MRFIDQEIDNLIAKCDLDLTEDQIEHLTYCVANYGMACVMDSEIREENLEVCLEYEKRFLEQESAS
jgi:hypothetical protein